MITHLKLYKDNPTNGEIDGTEISGGDGTQPLTFALNAGENETAAQKVAVRLMSGYALEGDCVIYFTGTTASKWAAAADDNFSDTTTALTFGDWQSSLTLSNVTTVNSIFWVRSSASSLESPTRDRSVIINAEGLVVEADA